MRTFDQNPAYTSIIRIISILINVINGDTCNEKMWIAGNKRKCIGYSC